MDTNRTGWISELVFTLYAARSGWGIATPAGGNPGYDLIIKRADKWETVQVKTIDTSSIRGRWPRFAVTMTRQRRGKRKHYSSKSFDLLAAIHKKTIWLIPIEEIDLFKQHINLIKSEWNQYILPPPKPLKATTEKDQTPPGPQKEMF